MQQSPRNLETVKINVIKDLENRHLVPVMLLHWNHYLLHIPFTRKMFNYTSNELPCIRFCSIKVCVAPRICSFYAYKIVQLPPFHRTVLMQHSRIHEPVF